MPSVAAAVRYGLALLLIVSTASAAQAAIITGVGSFELPGFSTGSLSPGLTPAPNNDNAAAASPNQVTSSVFFNTFGIADFEFVLADSGGTTEYRILFGPFYVNNTGVAWDGFLFELGFGTGASFVRSGALDLLDFDLPDADPLPTSTVFPTLSHGTDALEWSGATVPSVGSVLFTLSVDVPDGLAAFHPTGLNRFTVRQTPIAAAVPEPAALLLLATGGTVWLRRRRRQRDRS